MFVCSGSSVWFSTLRAAPDGFCCQGIPRLSKVSRQTVSHSTLPVTLRGLHPLLLLLLEEQTELWADVEVRPGSGPTSCHTVPAAKEWPVI